MKQQPSRTLVVCFATLFALYLGSYLYKSRTADRIGERLYDLDGYYFTISSGLPANGWHREMFWRRFYSPLILIESVLGTGDRPGSEPLRSLS